MLRRVFRSCFQAYEQLEPFPRHSEYRADFAICARRALAGTELGELYRLYFLAGIGWRGCAALSGLSKGEIYHAVYRIEKLIGISLLEHDLYPARVYFDTWMPTWRQRTNRHFLIQQLF